MPSSALLLNNKTTGTIPVGTLVVVDSGKARAYDSDTDSLDDVIGVVPSLINISGRGFGPLYDGPECYENDSYIWNEDLTFQTDSDGNPIYNNDYVPFNPYVETDTYTFVIYQGFMAVLSSYPSVPSQWRLIQSNSDYNWFFIR